MRDVVAIFPHPSVAVNVLVCERKQPLLCNTPVEIVTVGVPHPSLAVAEPSAPSIVAEDGLQPRASAFPDALIIGCVKSSVHVAVLDVELVFPQASVAVHVLVCERKQPLL